MTLLELAERCEGASEPYAAKLIEEAWWAVNPNYADGRRLQQLLDANALTDAAWLLVPENGLAMTRELWDAGKKCGQAHINLYHEGMWLGDASGLAATPALALTAASLRARNGTPS